MTIIFDYNRTLFDPYTGALMPEAFSILEFFKNKNFSLHLVSRLEPGREGVLHDLGIAHFFDSVSFVSDKADPIKKICGSAEGLVYVVGDYLYDEIREGNRYGARTIWFKAGRFAEYMPESENDVPWRTIKDLSELKIIIE